jgi:hypothetical protein
MKKNITKLVQQIEEEAKGLHPLQKRIIKSALKNLTQTFKSEEEFTSSDDTKLLLWEYAIRSAKKEIVAIATNRNGLSGFGFSQDQKRIDIQADVVEKGVTIHRIFAVTKEQYEQFGFMELVRAQIKAGITVSIAYLNAADYLNSDMENDQENYVIIDDALLYRSYVVGDESRNSVIFDKKLIKKYREIFNELKNRSYQFTEADLPKAFSEL